MVVRRLLLPVSLAALCVAPAAFAQQAGGGSWIRPMPCAGRERISHRWICVSPMYARAAARFGWITGRHGFR